MNTPRTIIDLTYPLDETAIHWPGDPGFSLHKESDGMVARDRYYYANSFTTGEHIGTHLDAPRHMNPRGWTVDQIPPEQLVGEGVLIDVTAAGGWNPDYQIPVEAVTEWESRCGPIPPGAIVLFRTGHARHWPDRAAYLGTADQDPSAAERLHFPGLRPDTARWLTDRGLPRAVGIDTPGIDYGQSRTFESHRILFGRNIPVYENLANLRQLPPSGFTVISLPLPIKEGSGAPLRILAWLGPC